MENTKGDLLVYSWNWKEIDKNLMGLNKDQFLISVHLHTIPVLESFFYDFSDTTGYDPGHPGHSIDIFDVWYVYTTYQPIFSILLRLESADQCQRLPKAQ